MTRRARARRGTCSTLPLAVRRTAIAIVYVHVYTCICMYAMPLEYFCEIPPLIACLAGGADADMDGLLEDIALRDAAALENAFYDLKGC